MVRDIITDLGIAGIITQDQLLTDMAYTIIRLQVGVSLTESVTAGLDTPITEPRIIIHPGGDLPDTATVTGMVTTMGVAADITGGIIMVIITVYIRAAAQVIVQVTLMGIRHTARIFIKAGQLV